MHDEYRRLRYEDGRVYFNHHDITRELEELTPYYLKQEFVPLGWKLGEILEHNAGGGPPDRHHKAGPGDDPKRDYFEKIGAQFAAGFLVGTEVGEFDEVDLFECLHREPKAVEVFYKADMTLKEGLYKKDPTDAVKGLDEMLGYIVELVMEDYPHTHVQVCKDFDKTKRGQWATLANIMKLEKDPETTLQTHDGKFFFNKKDVTEEGGKMIEEYIKGEFRFLGYTLGKNMKDAAAPGVKFLH